MNLLMTFESLKCGNRTNNVILFDDGRVSLLPLCFTLNARIYGPAHVREWIPVVREFYTKHFSFRGKSKDEIPEEQNNRHKNLLIKQSSIVQSGIQVHMDLESHLQEILNLPWIHYQKEAMFVMIPSLIWWQLSWLRISASFNIETKLWNLMESCLMRIRKKRLSLT